jgi:hypothetical protein
MEDFDADPFEREVPLRTDIQIRVDIQLAGPVAVTCDGEEVQVGLRALTGTRIEPQPANGYGRHRTRPAALLAIGRSSTLQSKSRAVTSDLLEHVAALSRDASQLSGQISLDLASGVRERPGELGVIP